jgi:hypothetical protein
MKPAAEFYFMNKNSDNSHTVVFKFINESGKICTDKNSGEEIYAYTEYWAEFTKGTLSTSLKENIKIIKSKIKNGKS